MMQLRHLNGGADFPLVCVTMYYLLSGSPRLKIYMSLLK
jgi:hypothetical protein